MAPRPARLNNVTMYVAAAQFDELADFYGAILGAEVVFDQAGHIRCFDLGPERSLCIHEEEPGRVAGGVEVICWVEDLEAFRTTAASAGVTPTEVAGGALQVTDPTGRLLRFQELPRR